MLLFTAFRCYTLFATLLCVTFAQIPGGDYHGYTDKAYFVYPQSISYWDSNGGYDNLTLAHGGNFTVGRNSTLTAVFPWDGAWFMKINVRDSLQGNKSWFTLTDANQTVNVPEANKPYSWNWTATLGEQIQMNGPVIQGFLYIYAPFNCCVYQKLNGFYSDWVNFTDPSKANVPTSEGGSSQPSLLPPSPPDNGMSSGAKAGIGVGVALGVLLLIAVIILALWLRKRKQAKSKQEASPFGGNSYQSPETLSGQVSTMSPQIQDEKTDRETSTMSSIAGQVHPAYANEPYELQGSPARMAEMDSIVEEKEREGAISPASQGPPLHLGHERMPEDSIDIATNHDENQGSWLVT